MTSNRPYLLRAIHEWICDNGFTPYVVVDASWPGLLVPPQAISDGRVVLNLAPRAVVRLDIGNDSIACVARFGGVSHSLEIPIAAVQAIYARENGQGMMLADAASDGAEPAARPDLAAAGAGQSSASARPAPALQAVSSAEPLTTMAPVGDAEDIAVKGGDNAKPARNGRPSLHVVK